MATGNICLLAGHFLIALQTGTDTHQGTLWRCYPQFWERHQMAELLSKLGVEELHCEVTSLQPQREAWSQWISIAQITWVPEGYKLAWALREKDIISLEKYSKRLPSETEESPSLCPKNRKKRPESPRWVELRLPIRSLTIHNLKW